MNKSFSSSSQIKSIKQQLTGQAFATAAALISNTIGLALLAFLSNEVNKLPIQREQLLALNQLATVIALALVTAAVATLALAVGKNCEGSSDDRKIY